MEFLDKWEKKLGWLSFPGLLRYYALFHVMVFLLQYVNPNIGGMLDFDLVKIMDGEVWRAVTFLFSTSGLRGLGGFALVGLYFMVIIGFMVSDGLEEAWGVFRTSLFFYTGLISLLVANLVCFLLFRAPMPMSGMLLYEGAFFAFATLFPRVEFLLFFILPVQVRWLAIVGALGLLVSIFKIPVLFPFMLLAFANYILWAAIPALRGRARMAKSGVRRKKFERANRGDEDAFHSCAECGRTEVSDPDLEFRMSADGKEYCVDHLEV